MTNHFFVCVTLRFLLPVAPLPLQPTWKFPFKEWYPIQRNCTYGPLTGLPCVYDTGATLTRMYGPGWKQPSRKLEVH